MGFRSTGTLKTGAAFWIQWIIRTALNETTYNSSLNVDKGSKTAGYTRPPSPTLRQFVLLQIRTAGLLFPNLISTGFPGKDIPLWIHLSLFPPSFSLSPPTPPFPLPSHFPFLNEYLLIANHLSTKGGPRFLGNSSDPAWALEQWFCPLPGTFFYCG